MNNNNNNNNNNNIRNRKARAHGRRPQQQQANNTNRNNNTNTRPQPNRGRGAKQQGKQKSTREPAFNNLFKNVKAVDTSVRSWIGPVKTVRRQTVCVNGTYIPSLDPKSIIQERRVDTGTSSDSAEKSLPRLDIELNSLEELKKLMIEGKANGIVSSIRLVNKPHSNPYNCRTYLRRFDKESYELVLYAMHLFQGLTKFRTDLSVPEGRTFVYPDHIQTFIPGSSSKGKSISQTEKNAKIKTEETRKEEPQISEKPKEWTQPKTHTTSTHSRHDYHSGSESETDSYTYSESDSDSNTIDELRRDIRQIMK